MFAKPGSLIVDAYAGTLSVAKACVHFPNPRRFTGCKVNLSCFPEAMPRLILLYNRKLLSKQSDIDGQEQIRSSAEVYVKTVQVIDVQKRLDV